MSPRKLVAALAAGAVALSACGGDDDDATEADELVGDADAAGHVVDEPDDTADATDDPTEVTENADDPTEVTENADEGDDEGAPTAGSEAFCAGIADIADFAADVVGDITPDSPFEIRREALVEVWRGMEERLRRLDDVPDEIADDVEIFVAFLGDAADQIEGFSSEEEVDAFFEDEPDEVAEADLRLEAFTLDECGFSLL